MGILKIPRITTTDRLTITPEEGELLYDTTNDKIYKGNGSTAGGIEVGGGTGGGLKSGDANYVTENVYTVTIADVTGYASGDTYAIKFLSPNTDAITINISGQGQKDVYKNGNLPLVPGDIQANQEFILIYDGTNFQILGIAPTQIFAFVTNAETSTLNKGDVVYSFSAQGNRMSVKKASNANDSTSSKTLGFVFSTSIAANGTGYIITQGVIDKMNLGSPWQAGEPVWLGDTAGTFTRTKPVAPAHSVYLGVVERANAGNGQIYVKVQNGYELNEIHDVLITSPADNHFLVRNNGNTLWVNEGPSDARSSLGATTIGSNLFTLTNPGAITFPRFNADNTISTLSASDFRTAIGATTVGSNIFTATNPSAVRFIRVNADNTITFRTAAELVTDLGVTGGTTDLSYTASTRLLESSSGADVTLPLFSAAAPSGSTTDAGLVPGANSTNTNLFLRSDRTWATAFASGTLSSGTTRNLAIYTGATTLGSSLGASDASIAIASQAAARTYTVPDAGASASFVMTAGAQTIGGLKTFSTFTSYGNAQNQAAPTINTRSNGSRVLIHEALSATQADYAIGTESGTLWSSIPAATSSFFYRWYGGATQLMQLRGDGILTISGISSQNYLTTQPTATNSTNPLEVNTVYSNTTAFGFNNISVTTQNATYTSITADVTGVTLSGTGMNTFTPGTGITLNTVGTTGLTANTVTYFVITSSATSITLASTFLDALNSIPLKTASGTAGTGTATANYVEVTGTGMSVLTTGTVINLGSVAGITGLSTSTNYNVFLSSATSLRLATSFANANLGTSITGITGSFNAPYTNITATSGAGGFVELTGTFNTNIAVGTPVYLGNTTGITGLNTTTIYYTYGVTATTIRLASTAANASTSTPINTASGTYAGVNSNLRPVVTVYWGPTRGTGIQLRSNYTAAPSTNNQHLLGIVEGQYAYNTANTSSLSSGDIVLKTSNNGTLTERFRVHGDSNIGVTFTGNIGSSTATVAFRHRVTIDNTIDPASNPQLSISANNNYSWIRIGAGITNAGAWPSSVLRPTGERISFGTDSAGSIGFVTSGTTPINGNSFWPTTTAPSVYFGLKAPTEGAATFNFFANNLNATDNFGFGPGISPPLFSIFRSGSSANTIISGIVIRSPRYYAASAKTITAIQTSTPSAGNLTITLNNVTDLLAGQVVTLSGVNPTTYNGVSSRIISIDSVTNSIVIFSSVTDTYSSGGSCNPVTTKNSGTTSVLGIYFDKDDDLILGTGSTFTTRNVGIVTFDRATSVYNVLADSTITSTINFANNSTLVNFGPSANVGYTFNIGNPNNITTATTSSPTNTINIGTGALYQSTTSNFSTTNITIGNTSGASNSATSQTNINLFGKIALKSTPGNGTNLVYSITPTSSWTTSGAGFDIEQRVFFDNLSSAGSTIPTRVANSIQTPSFNSSNAITVTNGINFYIAGNPAGSANTTISNSWALWSEGNTRLNVLRVDSNVGFYGVTPVTRATTALTGATVAGSGGTTVTTGNTFGGYTIAQIAAALQRIGILT